MSLDIHGGNELSVFGKTDQTKFLFQIGEDNKPIWQIAEDREEIKQKGGADAGPIAYNDHGGWHKAAKVDRWGFLSNFTVSLEIYAFSYGVGNVLMASVCFAVIFTIF